MSIPNAPPFRYQTHPHVDDKRTLTCRARRRKVPDAFPIKSLMYEEAMELAYFGASVLHPSAMAPCIEARVPVHVRNVFNTAHPGTVIEGSVHDVRGGSTDSSENLDPKDYKRSQMFGQGSFGARSPVLFTLEPA
eukprot:2747072-Rhodomonas_salina.1